MSEGPIVRPFREEVEKDNAMPRPQVKGHEGVIWQEDGSTHL